VAAWRQRLSGVLHLVRPRIAAAAGLGAGRKRPGEFGAGSFDPPIAAGPNSPKEIQRGRFDPPIAVGPDFPYRAIWTVEW
jgi:hypothetical protein